MAGYSGDIAAANEALLLELKEALGARGFGNVSKFSDTWPDWRCPGCGRTKAEFARLDKNGNLLCATVSHHDHFENCVYKVLDLAAFSRMNQILRRFAPALVCNDCNVAEPAAKAAVGAPAEFSFAPYEIAYFIEVSPNRPHTLRRDRALAAYQAAVPGMALLGEMLRAARAAIDGAPEHVAGPVGRVLAAIRDKTQHGEE
jgi:hypothetical protein